MIDRKNFQQAVRDELATYTGAKMAAFIEEFNKTVPEDLRLIPIEPENEKPATILEIEKIDSGEKNVTKIAA